jgi:ABC-type transport system involved in cytochrome c biogenesis permease component
VRGIWALLERSLRVDARQIPLHLQRLLVMGLIYVFALTMTENLAMFGAPGLRFFSAIAYANAVLIVIFGVQQFASVITEEKEQGSLGLMMLTGLSPVAILLGKAGSRLCQVLLLLAVQLPFALLAITFGGVTLNQITSAVVSLAAFVFCLACVGLLASVLLRRTGDAGGLTTVWAMLYCFVPPFAGMYAAMIRSNGLGDWQWLAPALAALCDATYQSSVFVRLSQILLTRFSGSPWSIQVATNTLFGLVCLGLAWWLFPIANRDPDQIPTRRWLATPDAGTRRRTWRTAGRPWSWPLVWHAFHFTAGGWPIVVFKVVGYVTIGLLIAWMMSENFHRPVQIGDWTGAWAGVVTACLIAELLVQSARLFPDEFKQQTWTNLRLLPRSTGYIAYSKAAGMGLSVLPGVLFCGLLWLVTASQFHRQWEILEEPGFWIFLLVILSVMHLLTWLSTYTSQTAMMGRLLAVVALWIAFFWVMRLLFRMNSSSAGRFLEVAIFPILIGWCAAMQWLTGRQLSRDDGV